MKTDKEINEIIKQGLEEYAKAETKPETMEVKFSKEHEEKMKAIFDNMRKANKSKKPEDRELVIHIKFNWLTKVAVAIIVVGVFVSAVSKGIKAWRECKLNSYEGKSGEYSWLLPNDTSEMYKKKTQEEAEEYVRSIFPGLSGEISEIEIANYSKTARIKFDYCGFTVSMKIASGMNLGVDKQNNNYTAIEENEGYYSVSGENTSIIWENEGKTYNIYGEFLIEDALKLLDSINYEKIETNF